MERDYGRIEFSFPEQEDWKIPTVLAERAQTHGQKLFLKEGEGLLRSWTFLDLERECRYIAANLQKRGFETGDRLAIMMGNCPEYLLAWFGATIAGVVEGPINPEYKGSFLEHALNLLRPRGAVIDAASIAALESSRDALPDDITFFLVHGISEEVEALLQRIRSSGWQAAPFDDLLEPRELLPVDQRYFDLGAIISTSGTTGPSKGVMMSHSQLYFFAEQTRNLAQITDRDTVMLAMPLFHGNAQFVTAYPCLIAGATVVLFDRFSPARSIDHVREHQITYSNLLGVMMDWIIGQPSRDIDIDNSLRAVMSAPAPRELSAMFRERFGVDVVVEAFGQTEISLPIMSPYSNDRPAGAAGLPVNEYFEVRIVDPETDVEVPEGTVGELVLRPRLPWIINSGYWQMPEATAESRRNLWFHTGDGLRRDSEGWYYFVDRIKDALRRRGENISSFEVESAILRHPAVAACAVIGVPSEYEGGEDEVMAIVVLEDKAVTEASELADWTQSNLPRFLGPRYWRIVETLPVTPSQKIRKELLRREGNYAGYVRLY